MQTDKDGFVMENLKPHFRTGAIRAAFGVVGVSSGSLATRSSQSHRVNLSTSPPRTSLRVHRDMPRLYRSTRSAIFSVPPI